LIERLIILSDIKPRALSDAGGNLSIVFEEKTRLSIMTI
jgi:hypothetical protein